MPTAEPVALRTAFYLRVSKQRPQDHVPTNSWHKPQHVENQQEALERVCRTNGWPLPAPQHVFVDDGFSGAKARARRPGFDALCRAIEAGQVNFVVVWSVDRLTRSISGLIPFMDLLKKHRCDLYIDLQRLDTTTTMGSAMLSLWGAIGEIERALTSERVKAGLDRARAAGKTFGQKPLEAGKAAKILRLRRAGLGINRIRAETGHGNDTIARVLREARC